MPSRSNGAYQSELFRDVLQQNDNYGSGLGKNIRKDDDMTPLYRIDYKGYALIEAETAEQALEMLHQDGADQCEEEITEFSEIDLNEKCYLNKNENEAS